MVRMTDEKRSQKDDMFSSRKTHGVKNSARKKKRWTKSKGRERGVGEEGGNNKHSKRLVMRYHDYYAPGTMATVFKARNTLHVRKADRFPKSINMVTYLKEKEGIKRED